MCGPIHVPPQQRQVAGCLDFSWSPALGAGRHSVERSTRPGPSISCRNAGRKSHMFLARATGVPKGARGRPLTSAAAAWTLAMPALCRQLFRAVCMWLLLFRCVARPGAPAVQDARPACSPWAVCTLYGQCGVRVRSIAASRRRRPLDSRRCSGSSCCRRWRQPDRRCQRQPDCCCG